MAVTERLRAYLELVRPHNLAVAAATTLIGYVTVCVTSPCMGGPSRLAAAVAVVVLVAAAGYVVNDYYDVGADMVSKPWRPIPSGRVSRREALILALALFIAGLAVSVPLGILGVLFAAVNALSVYLYSALIKRTGFVGNMLVAANSSATIVLGALAACDGTDRCPQVVLVPISISFLLVLGREIVKGIEDYWGDMKECYMTLAVSLGPRFAARAAALLLFLTAVASVLPPLLYPRYGVAYMVFAGLTDATILYSIAKLLAARSDDELIEIARRLRSILKASFGLGALAFLLGPVVG